MSIKIFVVTQIIPRSGYLFVTQKNGANIYFYEKTYKLILKFKFLNYIITLTFV